MGKIFEVLQYLKGCIYKANFFFLRITKYYRSGRELAQSQGGYVAKVWNIPGRDRIGIEITKSQLYPKFLPSRDPTKEPTIIYKQPLN